ncbi:hypothetical protein CPSG_07325 [Coccidioides posadasii str. Silveira]|uniref:Uncharacterized protein n=1 Tax=Coccidioides posadasii (strain RMSCC 757 / Silveira) TaxID=443226 RepID=E9DBX3_COCPS|nr:hypothetical protein CPSG_07325 [Coccidioides posadasii str. Silveira]
MPISNSQDPVRDHRMFPCNYNGIRPQTDHPVCGYYARFLFLFLCTSAIHMDLMSEWFCLLYSPDKQSRRPNEHSTTQYASQPIGPSKKPFMQISS